MNYFESSREYKIEMRPKIDYAKSSAPSDMIDFSRHDKYEVLISGVRAWEGTKAECQAIIPALELAKHIGLMQGHREALDRALNPPYFVTCKENGR